MNKHIIYTQGYINHEGRRGQMRVTERGREKRAKKYERD